LASISNPLSETSSIFQQFIPGWRMSFILFDCEALRNYAGAVLPMSNSSAKPKLID